MSASCSPATFTLPIENWYSTLRGNVSTPTGFGAQAEASITWGVEDALANFPDVLPNTELILEFYDNQFSTAVGIGLLIDFLDAGSTFVPGNPLSDVCAVTGQAAAVYEIAQLSGTANTAVLSDKAKYPFFSRSYVPSPLLGGSTVDTIKFFFEREGRGWDKIALLSSTEQYGVSLSQSFLNLVEETDELELVTYQQFLIDTLDVSVELGEVLRSGARVIVTYAFAGYATIVQEALEIGLIGDNYVWFVGPTIAGFTSTYTNADGTINEVVVQAMRGNIGSLVFLPREGERYERYLANWQAADPSVVPGSGPGTTPPLFPTLTYDMGIVAALAIDIADKEGILDGPISAEKWTEIIRSITFEGATGFVEFNDVGDRPMTVALANFIPEELTWKNVALWNQGEGTSLIEGTSIVWYDNTTNIPDLDVREPFDYWSCDDKEARTDQTGKTVEIHTPDGDSFDDIDSVYHCDQFIDCHNLSDESTDCSSNYLILFIVFGIVTCLLILITCTFIPFIIVFGFIIQRKRVRASSPIFLMIMALSGILGYASTFAWYGKPHPVACGFQPWLLGLAVVSMISALCAKTWRIYRIFNKRFSRTVISDKLLVLFYIIMVIPAIIILILWTAISTPTASMEERDGEEHYVCNTGGVTGEPGGLVFFFILVGYEAVVLLFGAFLSIMTRKVPTFFNESKLIAISIYNLGFLAVVVIPVFLILQQFNPFAAWIIRTAAILYAFTATLWIQFIPKIIGVIIIDRGADTSVNPQSLRNHEMQTQSASVGTAGR